MLQTPGCKSESHESTLKKIRFATALKETRDQEAKEYASATVDETVGTNREPFQSQAERTAAVKFSYSL
jgi:hypothetical protein